MVFLGFFLPCCPVLSHGRGSAEPAVGRIADNIPLPLQMFFVKMPVFDVRHPVLFDRIYEEGMREKKAYGKVVNCNNELR